MLTDYVNFIKKAIVLMQHFPLVKRLELQMVPEHELQERDSGYIDTLEEQVMVSSAAPLRAEPNVGHSSYHYNNFAAVPVTPTKTVAPATPNKTMTRVDNSAVLLDEEDEDEDELEGEEIIGEIHSKRCS